VEKGRPWHPQCLDALRKPVIESNLEKAGVRPLLESDFPSKSRVEQLPICNGCKTPISEVSFGVVNH
jgi:hypothetical protein